MTSFVDRLRAASEESQSLVSVGLDVNPEVMPVTDVAEFNRAIVNETADLVCAYKPNLAFYEALGLPGLRALESTIGHIREVAPHCVIIGDCKRGDVDASAKAYVKAMFDVWGFDAATINPWGGSDSIEPWLGAPDRGVFIWCRGSNPGSADLQDLAVGADGQGSEPLFLRLARGSNQWSAKGNIGLVVGATVPEQLAAVRGVCPDLPLLIPGVGAQGGDLEAAVLRGVDAAGRLAIINSSRGIIYASRGEDFASAARVAASNLRNSINGILQAAGLGWG